MIPTICLAVSTQQAAFKLSVFLSFINPYFKYVLAGKSICKKLRRPGEYNQAMVYGWIPEE